jgi:hypothetical protein
MRRFTRGKRRAYVVLGAALVALAVGVSVGLAKSGPSQVKSPMQVGFNCGFDTGKKTVGKATFIREKGLLTVRVRLHGLVAGHYILALGDANCGEASDRYPFKVGADGDGDHSVSFVAADRQTFFVLVYDADVPNFAVIYQSLLVKLGSS